PPPTHTHALSLHDALPISSAEGASNRPGSPRTAARTRCGAASPTKPMTPATATAEPAASADAARASTRIRPIDRPDARAASSPSVNILNPGDAPRARSAAIRSAGATQATSFQLRFSTDPSSQFITSAEAIGDGDRLKINAVRAPAKLDRATPNRISASG